MAQLVVDLRSDTVTQPSLGMKQAMMDAPLGDDVYGEDPTVRALQEKVATLLGKEAALFVPSGTMGNLICVMNHCWGRGAEILVGSLNHIHIWEQGGCAQIGGVHPRVVNTKPDGTFCIEQLKTLKRNDDQHFPITTLVCVENTQNMVGGKVIPLPWMDELEITCKELGLPIHMDGARILNAAVSLGVPAARLVRGCSSVSLCLSKGLGAPIGSVIAGSTNFIQRAKRLRKVLGGGMRQAGMLAAAGLYAIDHAQETLTTDHKHAKMMAEVIAKLNSPNIMIDLNDVHTNIILLHINLPHLTPEQFCQRMTITTQEELEELEESIVVKMIAMSEKTVRLVLHCDITPEDVRAVVKKLSYVVREFDQIK